MRNVTAAVRELARWAHGIDVETTGGALTRQVSDAVGHLSLLAADSLHTVADTLDARARQLKGRVIMPVASVLQSCTLSTPGLLLCPSCWAACVQETVVNC